MKHCRHCEEELRFTSETGFCSPRCQAGHFEWKHTLDNLELGPAGKGES